MRNEVRYVEGGGQRAHALYAHAEPRTPLDELMEQEDQTGYSGSWLGRQVLEFCFADEVPWDWRMVRGRFAALIVRVLPEERAEMGRDLAEALEWFRGKAAVHVPMDGLPLEEEELEVLLLWLCGSRKTRRLKEGTMRLYLLAMEILPDVMRTRQGKVMTLDDLAAAFEEAAAAFTDVDAKLRCDDCHGRGYLFDEPIDTLSGLCDECRGSGLKNYKDCKDTVNMPARARWSWRAKKLLDGLPKMKWQRTIETGGRRTEHGGRILEPN